MAASDLESSINSLERSLDSLESWLALWTALVVIGLILEYGFEVKHFIRERPLTWKRFLPILGGILITAGVAGELWIGIRSSKVAEDLRATNHKLIAGLNARAEEARRQTETARRDTAALQIEVARAHESASNAKALADREHIAMLK